MEKNINFLSEKLETILNSYGILESKSNVLYLSAKALDSIKFISIIFDIEETFGIKFPDELISINIFESFETLVDIIDKLTLFEQ